MNCGRFASITLAINPFGSARGKFGITMFVKGVKLPKPRAQKEGIDVSMPLRLKGAYDAASKPAATAIITKHIAKDHVSMGKDYGKD